MWFLFGLVTGIAIMAVLGGGISVGASGNGGNRVVNNKPTVTDTTGTDTTGTGTQTFEPVPEATADDHVRGDLKKAKVVLIEYSDFECPFCNRHHPTMKQIAEEYGDDVAWVYRHFPLTSIHPNAAPAANASECAAEQGEFWDYADALVDNYQTLNEAKYLEIAEDLGLNTNKFQDCLDSQKYASKVAEQAQGGIAAGATGTPATFINGVLVSGAVPVESMKTMIDELLAQ